MIKNKEAYVYYMAAVKISKPNQFQHENKTWNRLLEFFKQENTFLKNRLAEVVDHSTDKEFLALAEQFQNKFVLKDVYIDELRHDINVQEQELDNSTTTVPDNKLIKRQEKLRNEMEYFEKEFNNLKNEFNKYLSSVL
ncbi:MAG: hypothetical protein R2765_11475 [Ferruginibacter sp.]|nr:hypothetical protein [Chitinophagaceae bacterium]